MKILWAALMLSAYAARATAAPAVPYLPVSPGAAVLLNTGSTNSRGYRIVVAPNGDARYASGVTSGFGRLSPRLRSKLFADLRAAVPLSAAAGQRCIKSASFGTSLFAWWKGRRSGDLSCGGGPAALVNDAESAAVQLHIGVRSPVMRPMLPNEHRNLSVPAPSPNPP
ncbi:MAG: hypothetical protein M3T49_05790 [Candidatus Eremiobacteraeota bacterium]|nr:hypothetical protein [Candidatus Eremiobacteraeota bacterium]